MAVLVDEAIWPWRDDRWAHLVTDTSLDELHRFAERLGLRRFSFQGDHYDVPSSVRDRAIRLGAEAVGSRELLRRLRGAGLRLAPAQRPARWSILHDGPPVALRPLLSDHRPARRLADAVNGLDGRHRRMVVGRRPEQLGVLLVTDELPDEPPSGVDAVHLAHPPDDQPTVELFVEVR